MGKDLPEYSNSKVHDVIWEYIHVQRDRMIIEERLVNGTTFDRLSSMFDLSVIQVKRIVYKCEKIVFRHCK